MDKNKKWLISLNKGVNTKIGAKARNLKTIALKTNFLIPKTIVLTTDLYKNLIDYNKIKNPFLFDWKNLKIPLEYENKIIKEVKKVFGNRPLVIRSSATCEDSPVLSFAGQYATFLNIKGKKKILKAIRLCYGSLFSENAKIYAKFHNVKLENELMAIVIQEIVPAKISGIIFTAHPVTGVQDKIIIEYIKGFGNKMVSGHVLPEYIEIPKSLHKKTLSSFFKNLLKIGIDLEKIFGSPQNIEWGFDGKKFYIFQSRPIISLRNKPKVIKINTNKLTLVGRGRCACLGQCQGKLRVIEYFSDYSAINKNEILFIKGKIDMRIIPKIMDISGIITTGGILSHFAVIAREFNKPCLVEPLEFDGLKYQGKEIFLDAFQEKLFVFK